MRPHRSLFVRRIHELQQFLCWTNAIDSGLRIRTKLFFQCHDPTIVSQQQPITAKSVDPQFGRDATEVLRRLDAF